MPELTWAQPDRDWKLYWMFYINVDFCNSANRKCINVTKFDVTKVPHTLHIEHYIEKSFLHQSQHLSLISCLNHKKEATWEWLAIQKM